MPTKPHWPLGGPQIEVANRQPPCRVLMRNGKWLVPADKRPAIAPPPRDYRLPDELKAVKQFASLLHWGSAAWMRKPKQRFDRD